MLFKNEPQVAMAGRLGGKSKLYMFREDNVIVTLTSPPPPLNSMPILSS